MRLPLSRVYRAFPELDRFDDQTCDRYVSLVKQLHPASQSVAAVLAVGAVILGWGLGAVVLVVLAQLAGALGIGSMLDTRSAGEAIGGLLAAVMVILVISIGPVLALVVRDVWLRRMLQSHLADTKCMHCRYSLLGLPVHDGRITCPECGEACCLADRGMSEEEFLHGGQFVINACVKCGSSLRGITSADGPPTCPECGHAHR